MSKRTYLCGMKQETIPQAVIKEAQPFIDRYGNRLKYLGDVEGQKAWLFAFPADATIGYPVVYLFKNGEALEVSDSLAFDFIGMYIENLDEIGIE